MNTILYFEITRKRKRMVKYVILPAVLSCVLFGICTAVNALFPEFNQMYMRWPEMVKDLLCLKPWSGELWMNVWQLFALFYPFYIIYVIMTEMMEALLEEERLETIVYLHNAGVDRKTVFGSKLLVWAGEAFACCVSLLLLHMVFAALLRQQQGVKNIFAFYSVLFLVCMLYLSIALFMAACKAEKEGAADTVMAVLILPWLLSRVPSFMRFLSELLVLTGREGIVAGRLGNLGQRLEIFTILSPLTWSRPALTLPVSYVICGMILFVVLSGTAFSIYTYRRTVL